MKSAARAFAALFWMGSTVLGAWLAIEPGNATAAPTKPKGQAAPKAGSAKTQPAKTHKNPSHEGPAMLPPRPAAVPPGLPTLVAAPPIEAFTTAEGLRVLLAPDASANTLVSTLRLAVGTSSDPSGAPGLVAALGETLRATSASNVLRDRGGEETSAVELDATSFTVCAPPTELALTLFTQAERLSATRAGYAAAANAGVASIVETAAADDAHRRLVALAYQGTPAYEHPRLGAGDGKAAFGAAEVEAFAKARVHARDAVLVVAGRFDPKRARALLDRPSGKADGAPGEAVVVELHEQTNQRTDAIVDPSRAPSLWFGWVVPGDRAAASERAAFELALDLVADPVAGRIARIVSDGGGSVVGSIEEGHAGSLFVVRVDLERGANLADARKRIEADLARLGKESLPQGELDAARRRTFARLTLRADDLQSRAIGMASGVPSLEAWQKALLAVDDKALRSTFQGRLGPLARSVVAVGAASTPSPPPMKAPPPLPLPAKAGSRPPGKEATKPPAKPPASIPPSKSAKRKGAR